ncbi:TonB-dependent receptor [Thermophagus sp. OGC60D27]|uniref:TonB-dependent receptor n=1 Tax=Thermophagus sp. OGC60D27 TaxID=3458415 RepID=UPI0040380CEC
MSKIVVLVVCMHFVYTLALAQTQHTLHGVVVNEEEEPLPGASVVLLPAQKGTATDEAGKFVFHHLQRGRYAVQISFLGYESLTDTIILKDDLTYRAKLNRLPLNLQEVVVTDHYAETRKKESTLNIEVVNDDYLKQYMGGSLMKSLERLPGISTIDIGSGQSKPVIRGLGFNRVVVVENNIKHEAQQWGADHGLEIDQYAIDNVEVVKGPASLMYGSDAIGGVIDLKNRKLPANNSLRGVLNLSGKSNNDFVGTSVMLQGRKEWFYARLQATLLYYGDYKVPTDSIDIYSYRAALYKNRLRNTAGKEQDVHLSFGILKNLFQSRFYVSSINSKSGFFANAHGLEPRNVDTRMHDESSRDIHYPYQSVHHFKVTNTSQYTLGKVKVESDLGFQRNFRQEWSQYVSHGYMPATFPDTLNFDPDLEREFEKYVYSGNLKASFPLNEKTSLTLGVSSEYQDNRIGGRGFIIPAFHQLNLGGFAFAKYTFSEKSLLQVGLRYDYGHLNTQQYNDWFPSPVIENGDTTMQYLERAEEINRTFSNISWSVGYNYNPGNWVFKANVGKSFRMPIAKELAANGVNYHHFSYEVGDPDLSPEISYQLDAGIEYASDRLALGATPFLNYFTNYIYLNPGWEHDRLYGNGNQVYYYTQSEVFRYGAEIHAHYELLEPLQVGIIGEYVYSEQMSGEKEGYTLPFSPPASVIFNIKYQKHKLKFMNNFYCSVDYKLTASQDDIVPPEEPTDGYQVVNGTLGGQIIWGRQKIDLSMQVKNIFNTRYFNHTSYYRLINVPEPGRNVIINLSIPF